MNNSEETSIIAGRRLAALDVGRKRIGVAICDELHITVTPKCLLDRSDSALFQKLADLIAKENIAAIVVGMPLNVDDSLTSMAKEIRVFHQKISQNLNIPVIEYDEAFSTREAFRSMAAVGAKKKKREEKGYKDKIAAAIILRNFLEEHSTHTLR